MKKTGLVVEGGGMKCAYSAGVLDAFLENQITFDYCIGASAGAASAASYVAGQHGRNIRFYTEHTKDPLYFGLRSFLKTGDLFNLKYIYGYLTNSDGGDPLDLEAILQSPAEYEIVATRAETGEPVYFSKHDLIRDDYRHLMASCAIPAVCRPVEIDGWHYYDGGVTDPIPIQRAMDQGCEKLVVILTKSRKFVKNPEQFRRAYTLMCRKYPKAVEALNRRHLVYRKTQKQMFDLEKEGKLFLFAPETDLKINTYTMDVKKNQHMYDLGLQDFQTAKTELKGFLSA